MTHNTLSLLWAFTLACAIPTTVNAQVGSPVSDAALERLAVTEDRLTARLSSLVFKDVDLREEIKRIGFEKGCRAVNDSRRKVASEFVPKLVPATVAAIRHMVPDDQLRETRFLTFLSGTLLIYQQRIEDELDRTAQPILQSAYNAMRSAFIARTKAFSTERNPSANVVMPKPDMAAALSIQGPYNLDNPAHIQLACAELLISPNARPTITTEPPPRSFVVVPNPQ